GLISDTTTEVEESLSTKVGKSGIDATPWTPLILLRILNGEVHGQMASACKARTKARLVPLDRITCQSSSIGVPTRKTWPSGCRTCISRKFHGIVVGGN